MSILKVIYSYLEEIKNGERSFQRLINKGLKEFSQEESFIIKDSLKSIVNRYYFLSWELNKIFPVEDLLLKDYLICALGQYHYVNNITEEQILSFLNEDLNDFDQKISSDEFYQKMIGLGGSIYPISEKENSILVKRLAINYAYPEWVCKMISKHFGFKKAYKAIASSRKSIKLALKVNTFLTNSEDLTSKYPALFEKGKLSEDTVRYVGKEKLIELDQFKNNLVFVEDEASQLLVKKLSLEINDTCLLVNEERGALAIDMAMNMKDVGQIHVSTKNIVDSNGVKAMANRFKIHSLDVFDSTISQLITHVENESCDKVLFIADSSSLGLVRRKPDVLLTLKRENLDSIISNQKEQLSEVSKFVKNGGLLEYAVFTYSRKESKEIIDDFLKNNTEFSLVEDRQIFTYEAPSDGVYYALLKRN